MPAHPTHFARYVSGNRRLLQAQTLQLEEGILEHSHQQLANGIVHYNYIISQGNSHKWCRSQVYNNGKSKGFSWSSNLLRKIHMAWGIFWLLETDFGSAAALRSAWHNLLLTVLDAIWSDIACNISISWAPLARSVIVMATTLSI